jgi:hypothetical protein
MIADVLMTIISAIILVLAWMYFKFANRILDIASQNNKDAKAFAADAEVHYKRAQILRDEARSYYDRINESRK